LKVGRVRGEGREIGKRTKNYEDVGDGVEEELRKTVALTAKRVASRSGILTMSLSNGLALQSGDK
jgi:hypothetical protein